MKQQPSQNKHRGAFKRFMRYIMDLNSVPLDQLPKFRFTTHERRKSWASEQLKVIILILAFIPSARCFGYYYIPSIPTKQHQVSGFKGVNLDFVKPLERDQSDYIEIKCPGVWPCDDVQWFVNGSTPNDAVYSIYCSEKDIITVRRWCRNQIAKPIFFRDCEILIRSNS